jgi:hypothetical protein
MVNGINGSKKFDKSSKRKQINPKPSDIALEACGNSLCADYGVNLIHGLVIYHRDWTALEKVQIRAVGVMAYLSSAKFASGFDDVPNSYRTMDVNISELKGRGLSEEQREKKNEKDRARRLKKKLEKAGVENG